MGGPSTLEGAADEALDPVVRPGRRCTGVGHRYRGANASADTTATTHPKPGIAVSVNGSTATVGGSHDRAVAINRGTATTSGGTRTVAIAINGSSADACDGTNNRAIAINNSTAFARRGNNNTAIIKGSCPSGVVCTRGLASAGVGNDNTAIVEGRESTANVGTGNNNKATVKGDHDNGLAGYGDNNTVEVTGDPQPRAGRRQAGRQSAACAGLQRQHGDHQRRQLLHGGRWRRPDGDPAAAVAVALTSTGAENIDERSYQAALARLPDAHALALRLADAGAPDAEICQRLGIEPECLEPLLDLAHRNCARS